MTGHSDDFEDEDEILPSVDDDDGDDSYVEVVRAELAAAGLPRWCPVSSNDPLVPARLYMWVEDGGINVALLHRPDVERLTAIDDMLAAIDAGDRFPHERASDPDQPAAIAIMYGGAIGNGPLGRPEADLRPLRALLDAGRRELERLRLEQLR